MKILYTNLHIPDKGAMAGITKKSSAAAFPL